MFILIEYILYNSYINNKTVLVRYKVFRHILTKRFIIKNISLVTRYFITK
jgi:hypothetical protein